MVKGWLLRILRPKPEMGKGELIWQEKAAHDAAAYMAETFDADVYSFLRDCKAKPDDPNAALALKGRGAHLYDWLRGFETSISLGESARSES